MFFGINTLCATPGFGKIIHLRLPTGHTPPANFRNEISLIVRVGHQGLGVTLQGKIIPVLQMTTKLNLNQTLRSRLMKTSFTVQSAA